MASSTDERPEKPSLKQKLENIFSGPSQLIETKGSRNNVDEGNSHDPETAAVSPDAQAGVQRIQAATTVWTKTHLIGAHVW